MTTTTTRADRYTENETWYREEPALPSIEELAGPLVRALHELWAAFDQRAETLSILLNLGDGSYMADAEIHVEYAHAVAALVAMSVAGAVPHADGSSSFGEAARGIVLAITDVPQLEAEMRRQQLYALVEGSPGDAD